MTTATHQSPALRGRGLILAALANLAVRHPRRMLLLALGVFVVAGVFGATALSLLNAKNPWRSSPRPVPC